MNNFGILRVVALLAGLAFLGVLSLGALAWSRLGSCGPSAPSIPDVPGTVKTDSLPWDHPVLASIHAYRLRDEPKTSLTVTLRNVKKGEIVSIDIERFERRWGCGGDTHQGTTRHSISAKGLPVETVDFDLAAPNDDRYFQIYGRVGFASNSLFLIWDGD